MIRILLIIEVQFYRDCVATCLAQSADVEVIAASAAGAVSEAMSQAAPDVVVIDASMSDVRGTLAELSDMENAPRVVVLALSETSESVAECAAAGVIGYVSRSASLTDLLSCLHCASRGEPYCSPGVVAILLHRIATCGAFPSATSSRRDAMTTRELEILELVGRGLSNKVIAARLHISHATAKNHVHHILEKLQLRSRTQVAAYLHGPRPATPEAMLVLSAVRSGATSARIREAS
jgi:two-component system nitrate/nitrite response regulator NarL